MIAVRTRPTIKRQSSGRTRAGATKGTWAEYCMGPACSKPCFLQCSGSGRMRPSPVATCLAFERRLFRSATPTHARRHGGDENAQGQNGQIETAQPARDRGARARAAPVVFLRHGPEDEEIHQPFVGVATCWNEAAPCNIALSASGAGGEAGREARQRHAARVHHDHRDRRDRHGARGDAVLAGVARRDRGHGRADDAGALLRRARGACRV
jgi:hypothetical protein